ncbi:MAG: cryptochrome/photolyase family protein [Mesonia hippocampi]|uniref:cryptochrome/photolyase family protein n=1 Tax=Mesonia hippocampi TaxID=1628250 RepID=UPI003F97556F
MPKINIFWFRRDLRLVDNVGLYSALNSSNPILPIFIFDPEILENLPKNDARLSFIFKQLEALKKILREKNNTNISVFYGNPLHIFKKLTQQYQIQQVYTNHDYEPYAIQRDLAIKNYLEDKNIQFLSYKDQVIFEKDEITKKDGTPYLVYTPYMKKWKLNFHPKDHLPKPDVSKHSNYFQTAKWESIQLSDMGFISSSINVPPYNFTEEILTNYASNRDFPSKNATSLLSTHLRFGTVGIRFLIQKAYQLPAETFLNELIWREFFMQILYHFPNTVTQAFKPIYDNIVWLNNPQDFEAWKNGQTGYPLVDAGMRELNNTGLMHNRVRMLVSSFLCKHLFIDWRWGEAYFAEKLLDYEMASNVGNWQWAAGCGVDAAPYFRIFNPTTQLKKFDKQLIYIKKWVPEFDSLTYPIPIIAHKTARDRCLKAYKQALNK